MRRRSSSACGAVFSSLPPMIITHISPFGKGGNASFYEFVKEFTNFRVNRQPIYIIDTYPFHVTVAYSALALAMPSTE